MAKSEFDKMIDAPAVAEEAVEEASLGPRVIYTSDAAPDLSKMQVPNLRVAQGMSEEVTSRKAQIGQLMLENYPPKDEVILAPLAAQSIREYRPDPQTRKIVCHAPTGVHGIGKPGILCADCPLSKWTPTDRVVNGRKVNAPPPCKEGISVLAYSITHRAVVQMKMMGGSAKKGSFVQQQLMGFGSGGFAVKMTTEVVKNDKGQWPEPSIEMLDEVPEEHRPTIEKWAEAARASMVSQEQALGQLKSGE